MLSLVGFKSLRGQGGYFESVLRGQGDCFQSLLKQTQNNLPDSLKQTQPCPLNRYVYHIPCVDGSRSVGTEPSLILTRLFGTGTPRSSYFRFL